MAAAEMTDQTAPVRRVSVDKEKNAIYGEAIFEAEHGRPYLEGFLDKYAQKFPFNWKTRYFELGYDCVLRYYTAELHDPRRMQKGWINIKGATVLGEHKNSPAKWFKGRDNGMSITCSSGRVLNLSAPSAAAQSKWLRVLKEATVAIKTPDEQLSPTGSAATSPDATIATSATTPAPVPCRPAPPTAAAADVAGRGSGDDDQPPHDDDGRRATFSMPAPPPVAPYVPTPEPEEGFTGAAGDAADSESTPSATGGGEGGSPDAPRADDVNTVAASTPAGAPDPPCVHCDDVEVSAAPPAAADPDLVPSFAPAAPPEEADAEYEIAVDSEAPPRVYENAATAAAAPGPNDEADAAAAAALYDAAAVTDTAEASALVYDLAVGGGDPDAETPREDGSVYDVAANGGPAAPDPTEPPYETASATAVVADRQVNPNGAAYDVAAAELPPRGEGEGGVGAPRGPGADRKSPYAQASMPDDADDTPIVSPHLQLHPDARTAASGSGDDGGYTPAPLNATARVSDWDEDDDAAEAAVDAATFPVVDARASFSARKTGGTAANPDQPTAPARRKKKRTAAPPPTAKGGGAGADGPEGASAATSS
mmetsp:Transcript_9109/g.27546  ORF Transcript_9109/g.27546 Transcript_9109/m.27546 type:complete len:595 (+) Transcript_9109:443-2227(+)